jgi:hypothetical protein
MGSCAWVVRDATMRSQLSLAQCLTCGPSYVSLCELYLHITRTMLASDCITYMDLVVQVAAMFPASGIVMRINNCSVRQQAWLCRCALWCQATLFGPELPVVQHHSCAARPYLTAELIVACKRCGLHTADVLRKQAS